MTKRFLTLDDLVQFCSEKKLYKFDSKENGGTICVHIPATFEEEEEDPLTMYGKIKLMHTGKNRNGSNLLEDAAKGCFSSIKYKPLLANFCEYEDENGETVKDFTSHDMEFNEDGTVTYIERQIGCFTASDPYFEDLEDGKKMVCAEVAIPKVYTDAYEIIKRKGGTKVSAELEIYSMSYDAKAKELLLEEVEVMGATCLGVDPDTHIPVEEGMAGARLDIEDFSSKNNSITFEANEEMIKTLKELKTILDSFNMDNSRKEDEKLQTQFDETKKLPEDDATAGTTEAEPEQQQTTQPETNTTQTTESETNQSSTTEPETNGQTTESSTSAEPEDPADPDATDTGSFSLKATFSFREKVKEFSLSLNEKIQALYELVNDTYSETDDDFYSVEVFEDEKYVVMHGYWYGKHYRQSYKEKSGVFTLTGDRVEVFARFLTDDEIKELDKMKGNYSAISEKLAKYEDEPKKLEILNSKKYSYIFDSEEFKALKERENYFDMSVSEVEEKANKILLENAEKGALQMFSKEEDTVGKKTLPINEEKETKKSSRYGNLVKKN